jgi:hypothetical protein
MNKVDKLGQEIKNIFEEDSEGIALSNETINNIIKNSKPSRMVKFRELMNKEIEIPLAPAIAGLAALLVISILPKGVFKDHNIQVIDIGGSQIIIRDDREVADN